MEHIPAKRGLSDLSPDWEYFHPPVVKGWLDESGFGILAEISKKTRVNTVYLATCIIQGIALRGITLAPLPHTRCSVHIMAGK